MLILLVVAGCAGIFVEFRTLFGREAGVAMLVMFMAMKLLEVKSQRDAMVVVTLGYFLLLTHFSILKASRPASGSWPRCGS